MSLTKSDWILLILKDIPLDRIHIMKALFLIWHRAGRNINNYFEFIPYLYGPCSLEVYSVLEKLQLDGSIVQSPHPRPQWVTYYLSEGGRKEAKEALKKASTSASRLIADVIKDVSQLGFYDLLRMVYAEAPDFAINSMFKEVIK